MGGGFGEGELELGGWRGGLEGFGGVKRGVSGVRGCWGDDHLSPLGVLSSLNLGC